METLRVLVVDDETGMRLAVARVLNTYTVRPDESDDHVVGFAIETAETGEAALEMMAASVPDILLLDMKLPGMSGLDVLREIRERRLETLTVMITGLRHARNRDRGHQARGPRLPAEAVHAGRPARGRPARRPPPAGPARGAAAGRGEAAGPLPVHLGARARAQGPAGRRRGVPPDPQGRDGRQRSRRRGPRHRSGAGPHRGHAQAHRGPAEHDADRVGAEAARPGGRRPARRGRGRDRDGGGGGSRARHRDPPRCARARPPRRGSRRARHHLQQPRQQRREVQPRRRRA